MSETDAAASFRALLDRPGLVVAPGVYDAITARLVEHAGFPLAYMTGAGTAAAHGFPDYGLVTMTEMVRTADVVARSVSIPVLADADTGYGNELNVTRTVREFEAVGVAGIHLEDQVSPKRCGHLDGKDVVDRDRFISLISAAVAARRSSDFVIVARTDAVAVHGFDEAIDRANAALDAGADVAFVEALTSRNQAAAVPDQVHGPCLLNLVPGGKTPLLDLPEVDAMGYRVAICPTLLLATAVRSGETVLAELADTKRHPESDGMSLVDLFRRFGTEEWDELTRKFA